jgi:hypothetical protein
MMTEDRLRELMRDPGWSLPAWPDAQARVRRAARRQRMALARLGAAVTAIITMAAIVPVLVLNRGVPETTSWPGPFALPGVGKAGFTTAIYPAPVHAQAMASWLTWCPSTEGLEAPGRNAAGQTLTVLRRWAQPALVSVVQPTGVPMALAAQSPEQQVVSFLRLSDRAFWPKLASRSGLTWVIRAAQVPVLYSGPLRSYRGVDGPANLARIVGVGCGSRIVRDTWVIVSGQAASPMRAAETLFLKRHGHVLLYNAIPRLD